MVCSPETGPHWELPRVAGPCPCPPHPHPLGCGDSSGQTQPHRSNRAFTFPRTLGHAWERLSRTPPYLSLLPPPPPLPPLVRKLLPGSLAGKEELE